MQVLTLEQVCVHSEIALETAQVEKGVSGQGNCLPATQTSSQLTAMLRHVSALLLRRQLLDEFLPALTALTAQAAQAELCVLLLTDEASPNRLHITNCFPDICSQKLVVQDVHIETTLLERLHADMLMTTLAPIRGQECDAINPLKNVEFETLLVVPLFVGTECIGLLNCYSPKDVVYSTEEQLVLCTIANQAALRIQSLRSQSCVGTEHQQLVSTFVNDLIAGDISHSELQRRANYLEYDLTSPHIVVQIEVERAVQHMQSQAESETGEQRKSYQQLLVRVQHLLQKIFIGTLVTLSKTGMTCLLTLGRIPIEQINTRLQALRASIVSEQQTRLTIGISNCCTCIGEYQRGAAEAREALEIGRCLSCEGASLHFNELGIYRYVYPFLHTNGPCDQYQEQIAVIAEYDQRKKTVLLDTLEAYLECGANITRTAELLHVHRNTLLQRIERLQFLCKLDLGQHTYWLPLQAALKVYRLRGADAFTLTASMHHPIS